MPSYHGSHRQISHSLSPTQIGCLVTHLVAGVEYGLAVLHGGTAYDARVALHEVLRATEGQEKGTRGLTKGHRWCLEACVRTSGYSRAAPKSMSVMVSLAENVDE